MKLLVVGFGNMGSAIVKALCLADAPLFEEILVMDRSVDKKRAVQKIGAKWANDFVPADVILLAVKPQDIKGVLLDLRKILTPKTLVVSIAAGVSLDRLTESLGHDRIVRVMPNTPALVGMGASGWVATATVSNPQKKLVKKILESFGTTIEVKNDDEIDMVTALSGSGPAYVFYFMESLVEGAVKLGLSEDEALKLAIQTVRGGVELARGVQNLEEIKQLRKNVTSKGGTTEKALLLMEEAHLKKIVSKAMLAAYKRAKEL